MLPVAAFAFVLLVSGCNTVEKRIQKNPELFSSLEPEKQELIRAEKVAIGFTPEMVRIAWDSPDLRESSRTEEGETSTWIWLWRESVYAGRRFAGFKDEVYYDKEGKLYRTAPRPVYVNVYRIVEHEIGRVVFRDGKVEMITKAE